MKFRFGQLRRPSRRPSGYAEVKENWGEEIYLKMGLALEDSKWVIFVGGNFTPLEERKKYLGRNRLRDIPYSCPMREERDENLQHFLRGM